MGIATTFAELIANPGSEKVYLTELRLGQVVINWAAVGAGSPNTYQVAYLNETITLADGSTEDIRKEIVDLEEDGAELTVQANLAAVDANAGSYWHDTTNALLYVRPIGTDDPNDHTMVGYFWLRFATKGIVLNSNYYEPYIDERGLPHLSQKNSTIRWGIVIIGHGDLILLNGRGYFDMISKLFLWANKRIKILLGGDLLPYAQYEVLFAGRIVDKTFTKRSLTLQLKANSADLLRSLPVNNFWTSDFAGLDPAAEGHPIPVYYGSYDDVQAPIVTCIDIAFGVNTYQFKICDHAIDSIAQVYVNYEDGVGWQNIAHGNENLVNATFTIVSAAFVLGISRIKVAFDGKLDGGNLLEGAPEIVEDILKDLCGYAAGDLDAVSFAASKAESDVVLNVPIEKVTEARTIIANICKSDLAYFDEDVDGLLRYRTWSPLIGVGLDTLDETDFLEAGIPTIVDDTTGLYWAVKVGYSYSCWEEKHLYQEESRNETRYKYQINEQLIHNTYIRGPSDATILAQRLLWISGEPSPILAGKLKISQITKNLGTQIQITVRRSPHRIAGGYVERVFEIFDINKSFFPATMAIRAYDLADYGADAGRWMAAAAPTWAVATAAERAVSGFWLDASGYADIGIPPDEASKNISKWW